MCEDHEEVQLVPVALKVPQLRTSCNNNSNSKSNSSNNSNSDNNHDNDNNSNSRNTTNNSNDQTKHMNTSIAGGWGQH